MNFLIIFSFSVFLVVLLLSFFRQFRLPHCELIKKWGGCLLVFILALYSNNPWVYAIAIFIIASIFTKLEFLENLAAIFSNQTGFWDYRKKQLPSATDEEIENKGKQEIEESVAEELQSEMPIVLQENENQISGDKTRYIGLDRIKIDVKVTSRLKDLMSYEKVIISKLRKEKNLFEHFYIFENRTIVVDGVAHTLDAMASPYDIPSKWLYVIEIKQSKMKIISRRWVQQIQGNMFALQKYFEMDGGPTSIRGIIIVPSHVENGDFYGDHIGILKYDIDKDEFVNKQKIFEWINEI